MVEETTVENSAEKVTVFKSLKGLFTNKYWLLIVVGMFMMYFMMSCFFGSGVYFAQYNMNDVNSYAPIANALSMAQLATMFLTPFIMKKVTKRNLMMAGMGVSLIGFVLTGFAGANLTLQIAASIIKGIGFGCSAATMFGLLQDAITYGQWKNGFGTSGMGNAASSFCTKVGSGIGTAALGLILEARSFDAALAVQSTEALGAIMAAFAWIPAIAVAVVMVCMVFFDLDKHYDRILADLEKR